MSISRLLFLLAFSITFVFNHSAIASGTMSDEAIKNVNRASVENNADRLRLQRASVLLANYEIKATKLIDMAEADGSGSETISQEAESLLVLSETVIESARFRLPQCDEYLAKTVALKSQLQDMSHETLEKDYHHDGALPKAPPECYHTKDLFVHPATVIILTRDDPSLSTKTRASIKAEIKEVLAHTEAVRQLVIY